MGPAGYPGVVCDGGDGPRLHRFATRVLALGLAPFGLALAAGLYVAAERSGGSYTAAVIAACGTAAAASAWYIYPLTTRQRARSRFREDTKMSKSEDESELDQKIKHVLTEARMVLP